MKYYIKAEKETTSKIKTVERTVKLYKDESIEEAIQKKFRAIDPYLQNFFRYGNPVILECRKL